MLFVKPKYIFFFLLTFATLAITIELFVGNNPRKKGWKREIETSFRKFVAFKSKHRGFRFWLSENYDPITFAKAKVIDEEKRVRYSNLKGLGFQGPYGPLSYELYKTASLGSFLLKKENSNKCILFEGIHVYRFPCYTIRDKDEKDFYPETWKMVKENRWKGNEIGLWPDPPDSLMKYKEKVLRF